MEPVTDQSSPLDSWLSWALGLLALIVLVLIVRAIWRRRPVKDVQPQPLMPIFIHSDEERAEFRTMMGVKERPPTPIKVVTPHTEDTASNSDSPPSP